MKKTINQTPVNEAVEVKAEVKAPKFDRVAFAHQFQSEAKCDTVEIVIDSELEGGCRATNQPDYRYIHIFKKGTTKNCFQLYVDSTDCKWVVGKNIADQIEDSELFVRKPIIKAEKLAYYLFLAKHEDAQAILNLLVDTYNSSITAREEAKKKAKEEAEAKKAAKQAEKAAKVKEEKPKTEKAASPKKRAKKVSKEEVVA